jgi:hypothetical protein
LVLEIGGLDKSRSHIRIGSRFGHLEQRCRCLPRVETVLGHGTKSKGATYPKSGSVIPFRSKSAKLDQIEMAFLANR